MAICLSAFLNIRVFHSPLCFCLSLDFLPFLFCLTASLSVCPTAYFLSFYLSVFLVPFCLSSVFLSSHLSIYVCFHFLVVVLLYSFIFFIYSSVTFCIHLSVHLNFFLIQYFTVSRQGLAEVIPRTVAKVAVLNIDLRGSM